MKRRVVFELDPVQLFDMVAACGAEAIGARLLGALLAEPGFMIELGLGFYGVRIVPEDDAPPKH